MTNVLFKESLREVLRKNIENFRYRTTFEKNVLKLSKLMIQRILVLGEEILNNLDVFNDDEIKDFLKIYDTISFMHDPKNNVVDYTILEHLLEQGEIQLIIILNSVRVKNNSNDVKSVTDDEKKSLVSNNREKADSFSNSKKEVIDESNLVFRDVLLKIKSNIDFFANRLIFAKRDALQSPFVKEVIGTNEYDGRINYTNYCLTIIREVYAKVQSIYERVNELVKEKMDTNTTEGEANEIKMLIDNLNRLVGIMYRTLNFSSFNIINNNLAIAVESVDKFERFLNGDNSFRIEVPKGIESVGKNF